MARKNTLPHTHFVPTSLSRKSKQKDFLPADNGDSRKKKSSLHFCGWETQPGNTNSLDCQRHEGRKKKNVIDNPSDPRYLQLPLKYLKVLGGVGVKGVTNARD